MSMIQVTNLTFAYDNSHDSVFENVNFHFDTSWKLGFIGRNGRGKTTFLNLLRGKYKYSGSISSAVRFDYFPFAVTDKSLFVKAVAEEIITDYEEWRLVYELSALEMDGDILNRRFDTLSMGEQTKFLLAALFLREGGFLLIDEPTNHLDMHAREITSRYLRKKEGFILVSHDRTFLDTCIDHILSINKANIEICKGNFSTWQLNKDLQDSYELSENKKLRKEITRLSESSARTAGWSDKIEKSKIGSHSADRGYIGHKSAKMMNRAKAIKRRNESAIEEKSKLLHNIESADQLILHPIAHYATPLVEIKNLSIRYDDRIICKDVNFSVDKNCRILLSGKNGCGKTSILKLILGQDICHTGTVRKASGLIVSYVSQDTSALAGKLRDYAVSCGIDESLFMTILRKLDFSRAQFEKEMQYYSGGQKKKVLLARSLCERAHIYVWDEPLNYVDILSRIQLEELILKYMPTMIFVEHDRSFAQAISTETIIL